MNKLVTPNKTGTPALVLDGVYKAFGGLQVTKNVSFSVEPGSRTALIGPNGAGKTTIFNLISGVYPIDEGSIRVHGKEIRELPSCERIHHGLARNFQNIRLMKHLTVVENLVLGQHSQNTGLANLLKPFGLSSRHKWWQQAYDALEEAGLADYAHSSVDALPYGLRKRVDLVRALMAKPTVLMLDEPAAGLNPTESEELLRELKLASEKGITLLVVEHDMHFVRNLCEHVIVLNFGELIAEGDMANIQNDPQVQAAYLGSDSEGESDAAA